jgi:hypothetical protein
MGKTLSDCLQALTDVIEAEQKALPQLATLEAPSPHLDDALTEGLRNLLVKDDLVERYTCAVDFSVGITR